MNELNLNEVRIAGIVGNDLQLQELNSTGKKFIRFNVATAMPIKDADGQTVQRTNWTRCVCFGPLAEHIAEHCQKGTNVYLVGKLESKFINDSDGRKREFTEVVVTAYQPISGLKEKEIDVDEFLEETTRERKALAKAREDAPF